MLPTSDYPRSGVAFLGGLWVEAQLLHLVWLLSICGFRFSTMDKFVLNFDIAALFLTYSPCSNLTNSSNLFLQGSFPLTPKATEDHALLSVAPCS